MAITESTSKIIISTFIVSGITIPMYGIEILLLFLLLYTLMISFDFLTGFLAARKQKKVSSKISIEGALNKAMIFLFIFIITLASIITSKVIGSYDIKILGYVLNVPILIGLIPHLFLVLFMFGELISILENMSVLLSSHREGVIFKTLGYLTDKLFNLSFETLKNVAEKRIDEKFENINKR